MKISLLVILAFLCLAISSSLQAQISFTMADAQTIFAPGKYWRQIRDSSSTTMIVGTASSSAQTWTLPTFQRRDTLLVDNVTPASTPYSSNFLSATHAQRSVGISDGISYTSYQYWRIANDSMIVVGFVFVVQGQTPFIGSTNELVLKFPLTLNASFTTRDSTSLGGGSYTIDRGTNTADAFGSITLPAGTFQTLRMKSQTIEETYSGGVIVGRDTSVNFLWLTKDSYLAFADAVYPYQISGTIPVRDLEYFAVITPTGVADASLSVPEQFELLQNYPNPFNPATTIEYSLRERDVVKLAVFNVLGEEVAVLVNGTRAAGTHRVVFDAKGLPSGVYFYRLSAGGIVKSAKMAIVR